MKDITLLIAHPDDEALFAWPVLDRVKRIVCASNDSQNPERVWCKERGICLEEVGELLGADVIQLPYSSEFYRLPTRDGQLKRLAETLLRHLADAEIVFSHNSWGEYLNLDHVVCHQIARVWQKETRRELLVSDIATEINWLPVRGWEQSDYGPDQREEGTLIVTTDPPWCCLDRPLFDRIKSIYDKRGCWTWSFPVVERARVYSL